MPIPNYYQNSVENAIASYDYFDLASLTAYKRFYAAQYENAAASSGAILTTQTYGSYPAFYNLNNGNFGPGISYAASYAVTFNVPKTIKGDAFIAVSYGSGWTSGANNVNPIITLWKKDGNGVHTNLGTASGAIVAVSSAGKDVRELIKMNIANTGFKSGDTFIMETQIFTTGTAGTHNVHFYFDPANRTNTINQDSNSINNSTDFYIDMPFKLDK